MESLLDYNQRGEQKRIVARRQVTNAQSTVNTEPISTYHSLPSMDQRHSHRMVLA